MDKNFSRSLAAVLEYEGGYVNNPKDPGGPTNLGITLGNFRRFIKPTGTISDLKALTREQAGVVYRRQYWDKVMASDLPGGIDHCVMDFAVNSGDDRAERMAQRISGAPIDGQIGPTTLKAIAAMNPHDFIDKYCDARLEFLDHIPGDTFDKGWHARVKKVRALCHELADEPLEATRVVVKEIPAPAPEPVQVPVVPKGVEKRTAPRIWSVLPLLATPAAAWGGLDNTGKLIVVGLGIAGVLALLFFGERIAARAKAVLASFES